MIAQKIMHIKTDWLRRPLWVLWFPFEYISLCHERKLQKNFNLWVKTIFCLGWIGL